MRIRLEQTIDDEPPRSGRREIDRMLAGVRNDDVDPQRAEGARGEKSFVAHETDVVSAVDAARSSGLAWSNGT